MTYEPKKRCTKCGEDRYVGDFQVMASGNQTSHCDVCKAVYHQTWKESEHGRAWTKRHNQHAQKTKRAMVLLSAASTRARKKKVPFSVSAIERIRLQEVIDKGVCQLSGIPFNMDNPTAFCWDSPSIDRIIPSKGYVDGNLRIILYGLNAAIGFWGEEVLCRMTEYLRK